MQEISSSNRTELHSRRLSALFFSRGRGYGHAIPDIAVGRAVTELFDGLLEVKHVSYATGAKAFREQGVAHFDLKLPENNAYLPTLLRTIELLQAHKPDFIISHEEFAALPAARSAGIPSIYIADWLPPAGNIGAESLLYADSILVFEEPGLFHTPYSLTASPLYVGPMVRRFRHSAQDRPSVRAKLGIDPAALVITVCPGGSISEEQAPISQCLLRAFALVPAPAKRLYWISAKDHALLTTATAGRPDVSVLPFTNEIDELFAASDIVITKGTRVTVLEAAAVGVSTITLSFNQNPMDDLLASKVKSNVQLNARATEAPVLSRYIERLWRKSAPVPRLHCLSELEIGAIMKMEIQRLTRLPIG